MWEIIISSVISLMTGGGIIQLINWKANKKRATLENESISIQTMKDALQEIRDSNDMFQNMIIKEKDCIAKLRDDLQAANEDLQICLPLICKRIGCKSKCPVLGNGKQFIEKLKSGEETLDYKPLNDN